MYKCPECDYIFSFFTILKSCFKKHGEIICDNCKVVYREKLNKVKGGIITFIFIFVPMYIEKLGLDTWVKIIATITATVAIPIIYDIIFFRFRKYEKYTEESEEIL